MTVRRWQDSLRLRSAALFSYLRRGLDIEYAVEEEHRSEFDYGVAAYIARLADYRASGPTREVEARVTLAVIEACASETEDIIATAEG